jgi:hypothetical protein
MKTIQILGAASLVLLGALSGACAAPSDGESDDVESVEEDLNGATPLGFYVGPARQPAQACRWINKINFHKDGIFDGDFGNCIGNLSGHRFLANGTYAVVDTPEGKAVDLTIPGRLGGVDRYLFKKTAAGFDFRFFIINAGSFPQSEPWFSTNRAASPISLTFNADWSRSQSGHVNGPATVLLRYADARRQCKGRNASLLAYVSVDGKHAQFVQTAQSINGFIGALVKIEGGHDLAVWFHSSDESGCQFWDSNIGSTNFHYPMH